MKFDEWFANQARKAFDSYEEIPDSETMQQFSALLKKRQSPFSQPIYWAVAAAVVLSLGFGFYFTKMNPFSASQDVEVAQNLIEETPRNNNQLIIVYLLNRIFIFGFDEKSKNHRMSQRCPTRGQGIHSNCCQISLCECIVGRRI